MSTLLSFIIPGIFTGAAYAIAASGLVLTYTTTRVFNIAHGAFGMVFAFIYWDFSVNHGLPTVLSLALVLLVIAPAVGWFVQRFVTNGLGEGPVGVSLVVTVGLLVGLIGFATQVYPPTSRVVQPFFSESGLQIGETYVTAHQLITIALSALVALGLFLLLNRTRIGTAMRASVDNPELLRLFGGKPQQVAALSWAIGMSLSALAGILLASVVGLDYYQLTLLVINAFAAAMFGRLKSLPMTFIGAMVLGVVSSLAAVYLPTDGVLNLARGVFPALFLFAVIVAMPQAQLRIGQVKGIVSAPQPSVTKIGGWGAALLLIAAVLTVGLSDVNLLLMGTAATYAMVMLSLVLLTGYGGHVSLAQFSFAGVGALVYCKIDEPNLLGLAITVLVSAGVGALVALPVLRLTGLYLALATLAFGVIMQGMVFQADFAFGFNGTLQARRLSILGLTIGDTGAYVWVMVLFFVLMAAFLLFLRRGVLGRMLLATRDSPAACGTLGLDLRWFRVGLFAVSAGMAGLAGGLFAGLRGTVGASEFQFFQSLLLLLLAVVFGVTSVTGSGLGAIGLMMLPVLQSGHPSIAGLLFALIGFGAVFAGRDPNGLANLIFRGGRLLETRYGPGLLDRALDKVPRLAALDRLSATAAVEPAAGPGHTRGHTQPAVSSSLDEVSLAGPDLREKGSASVASRG